MAVVISECQSGPGCPNVILGDPGAVSRAEKRRDESFQAHAEKPLGTDSHRGEGKRRNEFAEWHVA